MSESYLLLSVLLVMEGHLNVVFLSGRMNFQSHQTVGVIPTGPIFLPNQDGTSTFKASVENTPKSIKSCNNKSPDECN